MDVGSVATVPEEAADEVGGGLAAALDLAGLDVDLEGSDEAGDALVGLNANERPIEISFHYRGFETGNFQWPARLFRTAIMEKSEHDVDSVLIAAYRQPNSVNCGVLNPPRITICMVLLNRLNPVDWSR